MINPEWALLLQRTFFPIAVQLCILLLSGKAAFCQSQNEPCDSLANIQGLSIEEEIDSLLNISWSLGYDNFDCGVKIGQIALQKAKVLDNDDLIAEAHMMIARSRRKFDADSALSHIQLALALHPSISIGVHQQLILEQGHVLLLKGSIQLAIDKYFQALEIGEEHNYSKENLRIYNSLGLAFLEQGNFENTYIYFKKSFDLTPDREESYLKVIPKVNLAYSYFLIDSIDIAEPIFREVHNTKMDIPIAIRAVATWGIGIVHFKKEEYTHAVKWIKEALGIYEELNDPNWLSRMNSSLGDVYVKQGELDKAENAYQEAIVQSKNLKNERRELDNIRSLARLYHIKGEHAKSYGMMDDFAERRERILISERKDIIKEKELEIENQKTHIENNKLNSQRIALVGGVILLLLISSLLYISYRNFKRYNDTLSRTVEERTSALKESNKALLKKNKELEELLFTISHDLRQPVINIKSFAELLEKETALIKQDPKQDTYTNFIIEESGLVNQMQKDLMIYASIGKFCRAEFLQTNKIVEEVCLHLKPKVDQANATIEYANLPNINGSNECVSKLFYHLLDNALKFKNKGTALKIQISAENFSKDKILFSICDNGIGISADHQDRIFKLFQRLHKRDLYPGTGLGLAYCKKVVELHGGEIWVDSEPSKGSVFKFTLPKPGDI